MKKNVLTSHYSGVEYNPFNDCYDDVYSLETELIEVAPPSSL